MADVANGVKQEYGAGVKDEPSDAGTPMSAISEEVEEEDTGELSMPRDASDESAYPGLFLARVPKDLYNGISSAERRLDEPIRIGTVKIWSDTDPATGQLRIDPKTKQTIGQHMRVYFNRDVPELQLVAKDYDFDVVNNNPINTYIFTEKDLPGYRAAHWNSRSYQRSDRIQKSYGANNSRNMNRQRRSIPKKTALVGYSRQEASLHPIENEEYARIEAAKDRAAARAEALAATRAFENLPPGMIDRPGMGGLWSQFTKAGAKAKPANRQLNKAERLPQNELIDAIVNCFRRYPYWGFKTLVRDLRQPEAYVKETLNKIAVLVKSGPFANNYMLSQQYKELNNMQDSLDQGVAIAPQLQGEDAESDPDGGVKDEDDDDDDGDMEDVI